ncbi:MAG: peptidoglycan-binding domain-containing protein, partial [bacterium]
YLTIKLTDDATTPAHLKLLIKGTKEGPLSGGKGSDKLQYKNSSGQFVNVPSNKDIFVVTRAGTSHASRNLMNTYGVQTKVIDLSGLTIKDNTIRLVTTNTQRQWDIDRLAVDTTDDTGFTVTEETPYSADLHFRGISSMVKSVPGDAKMQVTEPDYDSLSKNVGQGNQLTGNATKYGDVTPLLSSVDDKFVIMVQGDELALKYAIPTQSDGTERDFIYYTFDYHKPHHDALGHTITPLPFNAMNSYPYHEESEHYPTDVEHNAYQSAYNTRVISWTASTTDFTPAIHHSLNTDLVTLSVSEGVSTNINHGHAFGGGGGGSHSLLTVGSTLGTSVGTNTGGSGSTSSGSSGGSAPFTFTKPNQSGAQNNDVKELQVFLNKNNFTVATSGTGSTGNESNYFGLATKRALGAFQVKYGLVKSKKSVGYGVMGPKTRALINKLIQGN